MNRMKALSRESATMKQLVAMLTLDNQMLRDVDVKNKLGEVETSIEARYLQAYYSMSDQFTYEALRFRLIDR